MDYLSLIYPFTEEQEMHERNTNILIFYIIHHPISDVNYFNNKVEKFKILNISNFKMSKIPRFLYFVAVLTR